MQSDRIERVKFIVSAALARPLHEREAYLNAVCGHDASLRGEVDYYLNNSEKTEQFIYRGEAARVTNDFSDAPTEAFSGGLPTDPRVGKIFGKYVIQKRLAEGGMGIVYVALDTQLGRDVALKVLPEFFSRDVERLQRFQHEARATSLLNHPNIVTVFEIGHMDGCEFIVTEYVEGGTLRDKMTRSAIPPVETLKIASQIAGALAAAHRAGIVHRDIKPENIMLRPDGYVKVLDFGLAKLSDATRRSISGDTPASQRSVRQTMPGTIMGTAAYMSPEQAEGGEVDARTDIWGLGVLLYEMAAGRLPFEGPTASHTIVAILEQEPESLDRISFDLQQIVSTALQKDKSRRYQSADSMLAALDELRHKYGYVSDQNMAPPVRIAAAPRPEPAQAAVRPLQPPQPLKRRSPYRKLLWLVPAAFLLLLIFTAGLYAVAVWFLNSSPVANKSADRPTPRPTQTAEPTPTVEMPTPTPTSGGVYTSPRPVPTATPERPRPERTPTKPPPTPKPTPEPTPRPVILKPTPRPTVRPTPRPRPRPSQDPNCVFTNSCH